MPYKICPKCSFIKDYKIKICDCGENLKKVKVAKQLWDALESCITRGVKLTKKEIKDWNLQKEEDLC